MQIFERCRPAAEFYDGWPTSNKPGDKGDESRRAESMCMEDLRATTARLAEHEPEASQEKEQGADLARSGRRYAVHRRPGDHFKLWGRLGEVRPMLPGHDLYAPTIGNEPRGDALRMLLGAAEVRIKAGDYHPHTCHNR